VGGLMEAEKLKEYKGKKFMMIRKIKIRVNLIIVILVNILPTVHPSSCLS
jgi:hypothetical protein